MFADMMCFPARQMTPPIFNAAFSRPSIIQYTAAPPFMITAKEVINAVRNTVVSFTTQPGVGIIRSASDLTDLSTSIKVLLGLQMPPHDATSADWAELKALGVHLTTLSYKEDESPYGAGFLSYHPLTVRGAELIENLKQAGIWLDLSHAGHNTARGALHIAESVNLPVLATHTGCYSVYDNPRNLPDDILQNIVRQKGIIGLYTLSFGLSRTDDTLAPFTAHLKHLIETVGIKGVAIGTDGVYENLSEDFLRKQVDMMQAKFDPDGRMGSRYPVEAHELNTVRKDLVLEQLMRTSEINTAGINGIMSANALSFLRFALLSK